MGPTGRTQAGAPVSVPLADTVRVADAQEARTPMLDVAVEDLRENGRSDESRPADDRAPRVCAM